MKRKFGYISAEELLGSEEMKIIEEHAKHNPDIWDINPFFPR